MSDSPDVQAVSKKASTDERGLSYSDSGQCIHQLIEAQSKKTPDRCAVIFGTQQLTYRQLNKKANQLAHYLQQLGVGPEVFVGIGLDRSLNMPIALLATLKAGGAYVPLDPSYPAERLGFIIEDTQLNVVLTERQGDEHQKGNLASAIAQAASIQPFYMDVNWFEATASPMTNPGSPVTCNNLAYVIYTSGSTGKPKGVAIEHRNTVAFIEWARSFFSPEQLQGVLASTSLCFDLSVFEFFVTLSCGGTIILAQNALELPELPAAGQVTLINTVPSAIAALLRTQGIPDSAHTINLAGEPLQNNLVQALYALDFVDHVFNLYGPSEDTTYSTVARIPKGSTTIPPIGRPISNTQIYLLDDHLNPVADSSVGEIYISGAGLARGYLNRPELTAEKFLPSPFCNTANARIYKTGDLAVYLPDGNLKCLGRIDHQVKIRGFRIELGEIEAVLNQEAQVRQSVVLARKDNPDRETLLVAYVVPKLKPINSTSQLTVRTLRDTLKQQLPNYMIPTEFVILDELPLTLNGKIDRRALPVPQWLRSDDQTYQPATTEIEEALVKIWSELLEMDAAQISVYDSFEELGGTSLLVLPMLAQVGESLQVEVPLEAFLENSTLVGLATTIEIVRQGQVDIYPRIDLSTRLDPVIYPETHLQGVIPSIFLTGASGFLGGGILYELLQQTRADIYCLVRATSKAEARAKIQRQLNRYSAWEQAFEDRIFIILGDLSQPLIGIQPQQFERLSEKIDLIYHCGAWVNFIYPYSRLEAINVKGTQEVIRLASRTKVKPLHFVSTIDVFGVDADKVLNPICADDPIGPSQQLLTGYARSKYVAEQLLKEAQSRGLPMAIYRPGNIVGHSKTGISQTSDFVAKMLQGCLQMGLAPDLPMNLNIVPVDYVSRAIVSLSSPAPAVGQAFNLVNPNAISWSELVARLQQLGYDIQLTSYEAWYEQLAQTVSESGAQTENTLASLTPILKNPILIQGLLGPFTWDTHKVEQTLATKPSCQLPDGDHVFGTYFDYLKTIAFLPPPVKPQKSKVTKLNRESKTVVC
ncbi:MAG: amino acid adenylation domain-containing protein [Spirulina sp. SIO3F2]|nr:amino acid adenylation domain-containing protein [Spirulina sp. SIO3F2]